MSEQTANLCTTDAAESLRAVVAERDREIERLKEGQSILIIARDEQKRLANEYRDLWSRAALKAQPSGVVQWPDADEIMQMAFEEGQPSEDASGYYFELEEFDLFIQRLMEEVARLNSSPVSSAPSHGGGVAHTDCRSEDGITVGLIDSIITSCRVLSSRDLTCEAAVEALRDLRSDSDVSLIKPSHGEQVREGWQLVPVEPTDAMLEAGDKYIGTPATYKAMLSACPSPAITKDFSQFLSAVMDAAGLIRHGRQSKELSEYLGMKCMEYRGAAPSAGSQEQE